ncbi:ATP-grasp domain-containing protein [Thiotrichales bacterium 19S3-7]|nr:ATP-grasp domain-containing protein [Thiotrichales bacterium 19S3-7]MCF6803041.1 ATP-grasp domain-containing protein [Thiotrichales bacterium 19S3-11]
MNTKAIVFIDTDDSSPPIYLYRQPHFKAAKNMGLRCITIADSNRENKNQLYYDSDEVFWVDGISVESILQSIHEIKFNYKVEAVFGYAGQISGAIIAEVCKKLGLLYSSAESISACNNKYLMRAKLNKNKINSGQYALCNDTLSLRLTANHINFPVVFKPPYGAGSAFIKVCHNIDELLDHYHSFSLMYDKVHTSNFYGKTHTIDLDDVNICYTPGKSVLIEEYFEGIEGAVDCIVSKGEVYPILVSEKLILTEKKGTVLENLLITPSISFSPVEVEEIKYYCSKCIQALKLKNDIVHFEFRLTKNGPKVIEINPRLGGLYVDEAFRDITGIDPYELYLKMLLDDEEVPKILKNAQIKAETCNKHYSMMVIYPETNGYFKGFNSLDWLKNNHLIHKYDTYQKNSNINADIEENYLLKCWVSVDNDEHAKTLYNNLVKHITPIIEPITKQQDMIRS